MQRERIALGLLDQTAEQIFQRRLRRDMILRGRTGRCAHHIGGRNLQRCGCGQSVPRPCACKKQAVEGAQAPLARSQFDRIRHCLKKGITSLLSVLPGDTRGIQCRCQQLGEWLQLRELSSVAQSFAARRPPNAIRGMVAGALVCTGGPGD